MHGRCGHGAICAGGGSGPHLGGVSVVGPHKRPLGPGSWAQTRVSQAWPQALHCMLYSLASVVTHCWVGENVQSKSMLITYNQ